MTSGVRVDEERTTLQMQGRTGEVWEERVKEKAVPAPFQSVARWVGGDFTT